MLRSASDPLANALLPVHPAVPLGAIALLLLLTGLPAADRYVSVGGTGDGSSWEQASGDLSATMAAASAGDTVHLGSGTFTVDDDLVVPTGVALIGQGPVGPQRTMVTGSWARQGTFPPVDSVIRIDGASDVLVEDLAVDGQADRLPGGVYVIGCQRVVLRRVHVLDMNFVGIWLDGGSHLEVDQCHVEDSGWESNSYSSGNISIGGNSHSRIHHTTIVAHDANDGYGITAISGDRGLTDVTFDHLDIDVKPFAQWNGGTANFAMELAHGRYEGVRIHDCVFNAQLSLVGRDRFTGPGSSIEIDHNLIDVQQGNRWIEFSTSHMHIHHNYFTGPHNGTYGFQCYSREAEPAGLPGIVVPHNIMEHVRRNTGLFLCQERLGLTFCNNTVIWCYDDGSRDPVFAELQDDLSDFTWTVANNCFISPTDRPGAFFQLKQNNHTGIMGVAPRLEIDRNHSSIFSTAEAGMPGNTMPDSPHGIALDGAKPAGWWEPPGDSPLVDAGMPVPGCTDDAIGVPDIGAYERGAADNRFLPDDFVWPLLPAVDQAVVPGLDHALFDLPDAGSDMVTDLRTLIGSEADGAGTSASYDSELVRQVDPEGDYAVAIFSGYLRAPTTGRYRFWLTSRDASRLLIHDQDVLENDHWHQTQTVTDVVQLEAGLHPIHICFGSWWTPAQPMELRWRTPDGSEAVVGSADLFRRDPDPPLNADPVIETVWAADDPVSTDRTALQVTASDTDGDDLAYAWAVTLVPLGAEPLIGTGEDPLVIFDRAGAYRFQVTVSDGRGGMATATVDLEVIQASTAVSVQP